MRFSAWFLRAAAAVLFLWGCSGPSIPENATGTTLTIHPNATPPLRISSTTFKNNHFVPASMVYDHSGCSGGNQSPQLSWTGVPKKTKSFAVLTLDTTAIFWHWGMYNLSPTTTSLPENAGTKKSKYGAEVLNDWAIYFGKSNRGYDGPCPPPGKLHHYVFTVYALDTTLKLSRSAYVENLDLAIRGHILGSASITGLYKT
ncbi:MAG: YbhB/YbcL family Raf kinase inhibitor-like protein [Candidatus Cybelea sp.]